MVEIPIGVLLYVNRSGSTLLSRIVAEGCADVFVFPEMGVIVDLLVAARGGRPIAGNALWRLIESDPRRSALPVSREALREICAAHGNVGDLLRAIAIAARPRPPAAILIKHEAFGWIAPFMAATMGDVRFLHIIRDPRAVASSMRRTPVPEKPGFDMARGSLFYAARHWRDYVRRVDALGARHPVATLRYEDLGAGGGRDVCARVAEALGAAAGRGDMAVDGRYHVAPLDHALHARIHDPFDRTREGGWRDDLTPRDIAIVESVCGREMAALGHIPAMPTASHRMMIAARARHAIAMARHAGGTARHYLRRPGALRALRARLALAFHKRRG